MEIKGDGISARKDNPITPDYWRELLRVAVEGNKKLPQAYLVQGILMAHMMVSLSLRENTPLAPFFESNPEASEISQLGREKIDAHREHGFMTEPVPRGSLTRIWERDKRAARDVLQEFDRIVNWERQGDELRSFSGFAGKHPLFPVFQGLLETAVWALDLPTVTQLASDYRDAIDEFMHKYTPADAFDSIPPQYISERDQLMQDLSVKMRNIALLIRDELVNYLRTSNNLPEDTISWLLGLNTRSIGLLFRSVSIDPINPLRRLMPDKST